MCTVSWIYNNGIIICTSNRDEHVSRARALEVVDQANGDRVITFPKDPRAGGTWIAHDNNGKMIVLLNGATVAHHSGANYSKSRGIILMDIFSSDNIIEKTESIDLKNIEPFTIIVFDASRLIEMKWDGSNKIIHDIAPTSNHSWSSVTLYDESIREFREEQFLSFTNKNEISAAQIESFHRRKNSDPTQTILINRKNGVRTFSITQIVIELGHTNMKHIPITHSELPELIELAI